MIPVITNARNLYIKHGMDFDRMFCAYLTMGFVYCSPHQLLLTRPAKKDRLSEWLSTEQFGEADTWHVGLTAGKGNIGWFIRQMEWYLPNISWTLTAKRPGNTKYRIYSTDRLTKLLR